MLFGKGSSVDPKTTVLGLEELRSLIIHHIVHDEEDRGEGNHEGHRRRISAEHL